VLTREHVSTLTLEEEKGKGGLLIHFLLTRGGVRIRCCERKGGILLIDSATLPAGKRVHFRSLSAWVEKGEDIQIPQLRPRQVLEEGRNRSPCPGKRGGERSLSYLMNGGEREIGFSGLV